MALDFPASSASPFTAPNGVIYTWNADGYWEAKADPSDLDSDYLKLDATNGPVTGPLTFEGRTTHEGGVEVTNSSASAFNGQIVSTSRNKNGKQIVCKPGPGTFTCSNTVAGSGQFVSTADTLSTTVADAKYSAFLVDNSFGANVTLPSDGVLSGFRSHVDTSHSDIAYNVYAAGDAPNYFNGDIQYEGNSGALLTSRRNVEVPNGTDASIKQHGVWLKQHTIYAIGNSNEGAWFGNNGTGNWTTAIKFANGNSSNAGKIECKKDEAPRFATTSDRRLKSNIVDAESMLPKFEALQVRRYTIDSGDGPTDNVLGFVADELQQVFADAVEGEPNAMVTLGNIVNADGVVVDENIEDPTISGYTLEEGQTFASTRTSVPKYQTVASSALIIPMAKAIQELIALNTALTTRVEQLETRLSAATGDGVKGTTRKKK